MKKNAKHEEVWALSPDQQIYKVTYPDCEKSSIGQVKRRALICREKHAREVEMIRKNKRKSKSLKLTVARHIIEEVYSIT